MTSASVQSQYAPLPVPTGSEPCEGRKAIHITIDFTLGTTYNLDLSQLQNAGAIASVQTLYIDNSGNAGELQFDMGLTLQRVIIPANSQAYMPILQGNPPVLKISAVTGTPVINIQILNFFIPPYIWQYGPITVIDSTLASVITNGAVNVNAQPITVSGPTDASGTIAAGGTAQQLFAANATRKRWLLSNPVSATEILQFSFVSNVGGFIDLPPGTTWNESDFSVSGDKIWVVAATIGHAFTAYSW